MALTAKDKAMIMGLLTFEVKFTYRLPVRGRKAALVYALTKRFKIELDGEYAPR